MFTHTTTSIEGLTTIRAFKAQSRLILDFDKYQDKNTSASFLFLATTRGFAFWLDIICFIYITLVVYSFPLLGEGKFIILFFHLKWSINFNEKIDCPPGIIGANVGLVITQVISLIGMCNWGIRQTAELENLMTSVERVVEYSNLPQEPPLDTPAHILKGLRQDWPQHGAIKFENVSLKYSENGENVLKGLNFSIGGGVSVVFHLIELFTLIENLLNLLNYSEI